MRRRRDGDGAGSREAMCRWFYERSLQPSETVMQWQERNPFPTPPGGLTVQDLNDMAACDCQWCAPRKLEDERLVAEWERAQGVSRA